MTTPSRRWFRFSLRTLFVAVTLICIWLGYQLNWIRQRREALASGMVSAMPAIKDSTRPPGMLWLFGEHGHKAIACSIKSDREENQIKALFPEADVFAFRPTWLEDEFTDREVD